MPIINKGQIKKNNVFKIANGSIIVTPKVNSTAPWIRKEQGKFNLIQCHFSKLSLSSTVAVAFL